MSPGLKPLLLPRLVEERRKQEQLDHDGDQTSLSYPYDSSSSDLASPSPITSTFSRTNHSRLSSSSSSLDFTSPPYPDSPASPTQSLHATRPSKSQLPDVQEEPLEREDEEPATPPKHTDLESGFYDYCLCDAPCSHNVDSAQNSSLYPYMTSDLDYDLGFLSDGDFNSGPRQKKRRHGSDAGFSSWSTRLGSRLPSLPLWRSSSTSRRHDLAFSPASDPSLADPRPSFSIAASSRTSSICGPVHGLDQAQDSVPATPALSFYESSESVDLPAPVDNLTAKLGRLVERDRATATTPLLPPLMIEAATSHVQTQSLQASPLQSPSMIPSPAPELPTTQAYATPPLSSKPSVASLRKGTITGAFTEVQSPVPCFFDFQDAWSDRLGHANFTIEPKPYSPEACDLETLQTFRSDWNLARTNYAKHLVRTGEHYGSTSKTYAMTEAKWAEIEQEWQRNEEQLVQRLGQQWKDDPAVISQLRRTAEEKIPPSIPRMLSDDGKFPELGDVEIIGPMVRDAVMNRDGHDDRRNSASVWLKNLAGKVGLRK